MPKTGLNGTDFLDRSEARAGGWMPRTVPPANTSKIEF
jgi:hypothetical protein